MTENRTTLSLASVPVIVFREDGVQKWYTEKLGLVMTAGEGHWVTVGGKDGGSELDFRKVSENIPQSVPLELGPCKRLTEPGVEFSHYPE